MEPKVQPNNDLHNFLEFLFGGLSGIAYVATKTPNVSPETAWGQEFFRYPEELSRMESVILQKTSEVEVYVAPALFSSPHPVKENFYASNVAWTEFDGNAPDSFEVEPSLTIQSSDETRQHVYWRLSEPVYDANALEQINRRITYALGADSSAWDSTQVLRPPSTLNHKRGGLRVCLIGSSSTTYEPDVFNVLPEPPEATDVSNWQLGSLPNVEDVLLRYPFTPDMVRLLQKEKHEVSDGSGQRAKSLVNLAYGCAQMGLSDAEIFVVLLLADNKWEKFKGRRDRNKRLAHIITVARHKYPAEELDEEEQFTFAFDFVSFLNTDIEIDWLIEPMLMEQGSMLMVGPSGIGKTQVTLNFLIHLALGKDLWHYKISAPRKVMFLSLEMDHGSLKKFLESMSHGLTPDELALLQENFIVIPHGEPWPINLPIGQEHLKTLLEEFEPDLVAIDSIGSAIKGSLSKDEDVQELINFNDRARKKYGCSFWYIHHMRKSTNGGHQPSTQDDIYGNQYLLNRASSSYGVLRGRDGLIKIRNFKQRLAPLEEDFYVKRDEHLHFSKVEQARNNAPEVIEYRRTEEERGPENHGRFSL